uniref:TFIIB domain-containing protein n=1 Tax=Syphacia muris TaxID=451379 RepID=A0A0N5AF73_9BILA
MLQIQLKSFLVTSSTGVADAGNIQKKCSFQATMNDESTHMSRARPKSLAMVISSLIYAARIQTSSNVYQQTSKFVQEVIRRASKHLAFESSVSAAENNDEIDVKKS